MAQDQSSNFDLVEFRPDQVKQGQFYKNELVKEYF